MLPSIRRYPAVSIAETLAGTPGIVDLWHWSYEPALESTLLDACSPLMSSDERGRYENLRFEKDRCLFLATRLLVRIVLSRYVAVTPDHWRFASDVCGKPRVVHPFVTPVLHFNLANTAGLVACVVSVAHESVGVDVERIDRTLDFMAVAERCFSAAEADAIRMLPPVERRHRFFEYWTLKECYVKATGGGLALPLDEFSFTNNDQGISISFDGAAADGQRLWQFALMTGSPVHIVAVGANTGGIPLSLRTAHVVPLDFTPGG